MLAERNKNPFVSEVRPCVELTTECWESLSRLAQENGLTPHELINRILNVGIYMADNEADGGKSVLIPNRGNSKRIKIFPNNP